jgi:FkbM family methyltransferase
MVPSGMRLGTEVISVCTLAHADVWRLTSRLLPTHLPADRYTVFVPEQEVEAFERITGPGVLVASEKPYCQQFSDALLDAVNRAGNRPRYGWYLQQLLKLEALRLSPFPRAVIWDADCVPVKPVQVFEGGDGVPVYSEAGEYHLEYFVAIDRILGMDKLQSASFIVPAFPIPREWFTAFINHIEARHGMPYWKAIIGNTNLALASGFSEFESLGTFVSNAYSGQYRKRSVPWMRDGTCVFGPARNHTPESVESVGRRRGYDVISFENWDDPRQRGLIASAGLKLLGRLPQLKRYARRLRRAFRARRERVPARFLEDLFDSNAHLMVVRIGANGGVRNDPLGRLLERPGNYRAVLVEPVPHHQEQLRNRYGARDDIEVRGCAAASRAGTQTLHMIPPEVACQMHGEGPLDDWALGCIAATRAQLVQAIHRNDVRGQAYRMQKEGFIRAIQSIEVEAVRTAELLDQGGGTTLLVVDVEGNELDVLQGLDSNQLPDWIVLETNSGASSPTEYLLGLGYRRLHSGHDSVFAKR